jgi:ribosomal protein S18 acetylase RimI-like enzyme
MTVGAPIPVQPGQRPTVLRGSGMTVPVRPWPELPDTAQLVLYQYSTLPAVADLERWCSQLALGGYRSVRTTALGDHHLEAMSSRGFQSVQDLVLLEHTSPRWSARRATPLSPDAFSAAADVDAECFEPGWRLDTDAIHEVCRATPRHRARRHDLGGRLVGYALSGRDARQVFLQRLAVHPDAQRRGIARTLVDDCLSWAARWHAERVLVNTHEGNHAALALYSAAGFHQLTERLHVFERVFA